MRGTQGLAAVMANGVACIALAAAVASAQGQGQPQQPAAEFQRLHDMGLKHKTASDLFQSLKQAARGGQVSPPFSQLPDWSGLWTAGGGGSLFGAAPGGVAPKLTPAAAAALKVGQDLAAKGIEYDENLSECGPPGLPALARDPVPARVHRPARADVAVVGDGQQRAPHLHRRPRASVAGDDAFPLYYGDSIGFWDGQKLVIHTNQLMERSMGRGQPTQSEQMETVEVWEKLDARTIKADVWIYDPAIFTEPWYVQRRYRQVDNPTRSSG